jgi:hypothetical protein
MNKKYLKSVLLVLLLVDINQITNAAPMILDLNALSTKYKLKNDIPARVQWDANSGYCGEVSMISAGLYYGQYLSQYDVRGIASPGVPQNLSDSQLLVGVNDDVAAKGLRLKYERKSSASSSSFYAWVKYHISLGHPVVTGVFLNQNQDDESDLDQGSDEYDHIVPVIGFGSDRPFVNSYYSGDVIIFSDNGLDNPYYSLEIQEFLANRQEANNPDGSAYYLPKDPIIKYGIAITGVMDNKNETLPVIVTTSKNTESPEMIYNDTKRPTASTFDLTVTVSKLVPNINYNLYLYSQETDVPVESFNVNSKKIGVLPWQVIKITSGSKWSKTIKNVKSNSKVIFRAVKADPSTVIRTKSKVRW